MEELSASRPGEGRLARSNGNGEKPSNTSSNWDGKHARIFNKQHGTTSILAEAARAYRDVGQAEQGKARKSLATQAEKKKEKEAFSYYHAFFVLMNGVSTILSPHSNLFAYDDRLRRSSCSLRSRLEYVESDSQRFSELKGFDEIALRSHQTAL